MMVKAPRTSRSATLPRHRAEAEQLEAEFNQLDREEGDTERMREIAAWLDEIDAMRAVWPDRLKAHAGVVLHLTHAGAVEIERGLIRDEDLASFEQEEAGEAPDADREDGAQQEDGEAASPALSAALIEELTARRTAALQIEMACNADVALALTVCALATSALYRHGGSALKAHVTARSMKTSIRQFEACPAVQALEAERKRIGDMLPGNHGDLWDWCLKADRNALLDVLAVAIAHGIDAVESKADSNRGGRQHADRLAQALSLDMAAWYRPTAEGYFSRNGKAQILADFEAARGAACAPSWAKMKKAELAALTERETAERGWLPSPLH